jgi:hypothetical protein
VIGGTTGGRYRIVFCHQMNVQRFDDKGRPVKWLCLCPTANT